MSPIPASLLALTSRRSLWRTYLTPASTAQKLIPSPFHHLETRCLRQGRRSNTKTCLPTRRMMTPRGPKSRMEAGRNKQAEASWIIYQTGGLLPEARIVWWGRGRIRTRMVTNHKRSKKKISSVHAYVFGCFGRYTFCSTLYMRQPTFKRAALRVGKSDMNVMLKERVSGEKSGYYYVPAKSFLRPLPSILNFDIPTR